MGVKYLRYIFPLLVFMILITFLWRGLSLQPDRIPSPFLNKPAPLFQLPTLFNPLKIATHHDFQGHITLLNVWATWCMACAEEHSLLLKIAKKNEIQVFGLNYKDNEAAAKHWLETYGNPYHIVAFDQKGTAAIDWGVYGTPESFLVDKKGIVRYKHIGPLTESTWDSIFEPLIQQLRNEDS